MTALAQAFYRELEPPQILTVSQWADRCRMLSPEASAEPGQWRTDRAPYQRAIMDAFTDPAVQQIVLMTSSQCGKTEVLLNAIGYVIDVDPGPVLMVQPTLEMAEAVSKDRLDPMLRDTPVLRKKISAARRDGSNTMRHKAFPGGHITLAGSNSAAGLASRPIRYVFADEVDRWETSAGDEGDPLALAERRMTTFWNSKEVVASTPTLKGVSRIAAKFEESDQRFCLLACIHCGARHRLQWAHVKWEPDQPETAHLVCPDCGGLIDEAERQQMLADPVWEATAPFRGIAGFHIWEGYSPWRRLADIAADFLEAKKAPDTLQVFVNTSLGEVWEAPAEQMDTSSLIARREPFAAVVPAGACCLTMGVDVQDDRLEALVLGWGPGEECWVIDQRRLPGDPQRPEPWQQLDEVLNAAYLHETGALLTVQATCIDTGGHRTQFTYDYVSRHAHQRVFAIKGMDGSDRPIVSAPAEKRSGKDPRKVELYMVGVDSCKSLIHSRLKITDKGPGYVHLPLQHQRGEELRFGVDEEFIAQLTAEKLVTKRRNGVPHQQWVQMRPRNEALDMTCYAIAALRLLRPDLAAAAARLSGKEPPTPPAAPKTDGWLGPRRGGWLRR